MNRQGRHGIEWCDYTWNPVTGCLIDCPYCYARRLANGRLKKHYCENGRIIKAADKGNPFAPRFWSVRLREPYKLKTPGKIFVCDMGELFGPWVPDEWKRRVLQVAEDNPRHIFQFLTRFVPRMLEFEEVYPFSANCWCGVTVTKQSEWPRACFVSQVETCSVKFISFEPLQGYIDFSLKNLDWVIIGAETGNREGKIVPEEEWIDHIIEQADELKIPVFMKENIAPYWLGKLRQEFPPQKRGIKKSITPP